MVPQWFSSITIQYHSSSWLHCFCSSCLFLICLLLQEKHRRVQGFLPHSGGGVQEKGDGAHWQPGRRPGEPVQRRREGAHAGHVDGSQSRTAAFGVPPLTHHPTSFHQCSPAVLEEDADAQVAHQRRRLQAAPRPHRATVTGLFGHESRPRQGEEEEDGRGRGGARAESSRVGGRSGLLGISSSLFLFSSAFRVTVCGEINERSLILSQIESESRQIYCREFRPD